jgi:hypothetical protein
VNIGLQNIRRHWWGIEGSYVIELEDGQVSGDLRGQYNGLETLIQYRTGKIKVSLCAALSSSFQGRS